MKVIRIVVVAACVCAFAGFPTAGQVRLQLVTSGLSSPVLVTHANDPRLFVVERGGTVRIFHGGELLPSPFLNLTGLVTSSSESGLLGIAFHPNYPAVPYFFVHFTSNGTTLPDGTSPSAGDNLIVRYAVSPNNRNAADQQSAKVLMRIPNPTNIHHGGMLAFGPDGFLYIAKGDGGPGNDPEGRAQNIEQLLGKILRINVDQNVNTPPYYSVPPTNPFASSPGRDEIFALGLRNPWRFSFDRLNGDMWIGDVGQGSTEEIDRLPINATAPGTNFGWRIFEGELCTGLDPCNPPAKYVPPVHTYLSGGSAPQCSVTGGYVYRGTKIPALYGTYVFGDFCTGEIWSFIGAGLNNRILDTDQLIVSFGESRSGELYVAGWSSGNIYRIMPNPLPTASITGRVSASSGPRVITARVVRRSVTTGEEIETRTNPFGFYRFPANVLNEDYIITVFPGSGYAPPMPRSLTLTDDFEGVDFALQAN